MFKTQHHAARRRQHLQALLLNLYAASAVNKRRYVVITLSRNEYSRRGRYWSGWESYGITTTLIDALRCTKHIEYERGFFDRNKKRGFRTRIRASQSLLAEFDAAELTPSMISSSPDFELIRLKDVNKGLMYYDDDDNTECMRSNLQSVNARIDKTFIGLHVPNNVLGEVLGFVDDNETGDIYGEDAEPVDLTNRCLYRVFNDASFQ